MTSEYWCGKCGRKKAWCEFHLVENKRPETRAKMRRPVRVKCKACEQKMRERMAKRAEGAA